MKVLDRYLAKEILPSCLVALGFIVFLLLMGQLFYLADVLLVKKVSLAVAFKIISYLIPSVIALALPLAFMAGVLGGLARLSSDGEIDALKFLGGSPAKIFKTVFILGLIFCLTTAVFTFWLAPAANYSWLRTMVSSVLSRVTVEIEPGHFIESLPGRVLFIGAEQNDAWQDVFIYQQTEPDIAELILARSGNLVLKAENKEARIFLEEGKRYVLNFKSPEIISVNNFQKMLQVVDLARLGQKFEFEKKGREKNIRELFEDRSRFKNSQKDRVRELRLVEIEIHKRLSLPVACLVFAFLGVGLGWKKWRGGRLAGYLVSLAILFGYYGMLVFGEEAAIEGKISPAAAMWFPDFLLLAAGLVFYVSGYRAGAWRKNFLRLVRQRPASQLLNKKLRKKKPGLERAEKKKEAPASLWPNILDRYLLKKNLTAFLLIFGAFLLILLLITFLQNLETIQGPQKPVKLLFTYLWFKLPEFILLASLVAGLVSCSLVFSLLYRKGEITALVVSGLSYYRIIIPLLLLALALVWPAYLWQDRLVTKSNARAEQLISLLSDRPTRAFSYFSHYWMRGDQKNCFYHYDLLEPETRRLSNFLLLQPDENGSFQFKKIIFARQAKIDKNSLRLLTGWVREFNGLGPGYRAFESSDLEFNQAEKYFLKEWREPSFMTVSELELYSQDLARLGASNTRFRLEAEFRRAFSLAFLILPLISLVSVNLLANKSFLFPLAASLTAGFVYWQSMVFFRSLGLASLLTPFYAAWTPQIIFILLGGYFLLKVRT
ncbi:MAG: LptF/LptG family permease [Candidatus Saccharicenans sp.]